MFGNFYYYLAYNVKKKRKFLKLAIDKAILYASDQLT